MSGCSADSTDTRAWTLWYGIADEGERWYVAIGSPQPRAERLGESVVVVEKDAYRAALLDEICAALNEEADGYEFPVREAIRVIAAHLATNPRFRG